MSVDLLKSMLICLEFSVIIVLLALFSIAVLRRIHWSACRLPGPYGLPFIGCVHVFYPLCSVHLKLARLSRAYGPIFQIRLGSEHFLVLNSVDSVKEAMLVRSCDLTGPTPSRSLVASFFTSGRTHEQEGNAMRTLRIMRAIEWAMVYVCTNTERFRRRVNNTVQQLKNTFLETGGAVFDPSVLVDHVIVDLMFKTVFGEALPRRYIYESQAILQELKEYLPQADVMLMYLDCVPFGRFLHRPQVQHLSRVIKVYVEFVRRMCDEHQQLFVRRQDESSLLHTLRNLHVNQNHWFFTDEESVSPDLSEDTLTCILAELFVAGYHKISTSISWGLMLLASNPQIQKDIEDELKVSVGDAPLRLQDKAKVPLLEATVLEILRVSSLTPLALPHHTNKDTTLSGYSIPRGTAVLVNLWACNRDPKYFACSAEFNPCRFLDETGHVNTCGLLSSFLTGARKCVGDAFSKSVLILVFGSVIRDFKLELSFKASTQRSDYGFTVQPPQYEIKALRRHQPEL